MGQITRPPSVEGYIAELEQRLANLERAGGIQYATFAGAIETTSSVPVALTGGPALVIPRAGNWLVESEIIVAQTQEAGVVTALELYLFLNGASVSGIGRVVTSVQFNGGSIRGRTIAGLASGDKLTLGVATSSKVKGVFQSADLSATPGIG